MSNGINPITHQFSTPYLTVEEFKNAPTAIDLDNLVFNSSNPDDQDAELANVIARASSWIDVKCRQVIGATVETEQQRGRIAPDGTIIFHPRYNPIVAITALSIGTYSNSMIAITDPSICWIEDQQVIVPYAYTGLNMSSAGPLGFNAPMSSRQKIYVRFSYVNGYANTTLVTATAGSSTITVKSGVGITAGMMLKIYDGMNSENIIVADTYTFGSTTVPLTAPLAYDHLHNESVSALPPAIKEAAILVTTAMLKVRGDNAMVMGVTSRAGQQMPGSQHLGEEIALAEDLLKPFTRIR